VEEDIRSKELDIQKAINQMADILELLENEGKNKIPSQVKKFFETYYDDSIEYEKIKLGVPLKNQNIYEYTDEILTYIANKYLR